MPEHTKLSQVGKVAPSSKRRWGRWVMVFLLLMGVLAALIWHNRYSILENQVSKRLSELGIEAELEIVDITATKALVRNIYISSDDEQILAVNEVEFLYVFKQALDGQFDKIILRKPTAHITLDSEGNLIGDWIPKKPEGQTIASFQLPSQGVFIENGNIEWEAPFGSGEAEISGNVHSLSKWSFSLDAPNTTLHHNDVTLIVDIHGDVEQKHKGQAVASGRIRAQNMSTPVLRAENIDLNFNLDFTKQDEGQGEDKIGVQGLIHFAGQKLDTDAYAANNVHLQLNVDTVFDRFARQFLPSTTHWDIKSTDARLKDEAQRITYARNLTAYQAMSAAPIAQYFADDLPKQLEQFLTEFSVDANGELTTTGHGYEIDLTEPAIINGQNQNMRIEAAMPHLLEYDVRTETLAANVNLDWNGKRSLQVKGLSLQAHTLNGFQIAEMQELSGRILSNSTWRKRLEEQNFRQDFRQDFRQNFRLAPFDIDLSYKNENGRRQIRLNGGLDYDGLVPAGQVIGLRAQGELLMDMRGTAFSLGFAPMGEAHMQVFESQSGWRAENIVFQMDETDELIKTVKDGRALSASLKHVRANVISPTGDRHLDVEMERLQVNTISKGFPQDWDLQIENAHIRSEDFPSPGTRISSQSSTLNIKLSENESIQFISENPYTSIETNNVRVPQVVLNLEGVPDNFTASYTSDAVHFIGGDIPALPMRGTARLKGGKLTGQAETDLPMTQNTPIDMQFSSVDGRGTATINIPVINFTPSGLQPQHLISSLRGKLAEVTGRVSAQFEFSFGGGVPIQSYGTTTLIDMDIGTLVGPIKGVNAELAFSSMFPLKTDGVQNATMTGFDPGFPMENGTIKFEIIPGGVRIDEAVWPIENSVGLGGETVGKIYITPMEWRFGDVVNHAAVHIENIELGTLLEKIGKENLSATGMVNGVLPARIKGVSLNIEGGLLEIKDGGVIQFKTPSLNAQDMGNEYAGYAVKALENFTYNKMEARLNGPLDGEVQLGMEFEGNNPEVLNGQPFLFNVGVSGELANIARELSNAFNAQEYLKSMLEVHGTEIQKTKEMETKEIKP